MLQTNRVYNRDFRKGIKKIDDNSIGMVLIDAPYEKKYHHLWPELAKECARVLKVGGSLIALIGNYQLLEVGNELNKWLRYWWLLNLRNRRNPRLIGKTVIVESKPALWFVQEKRKSKDYRFVVDNISPTNEDWKECKKWHKWAQPVGFARPLVEQLTDTNEIVLDPLCGSGSFLVAAKELGRQYIGFELDKSVCRVARQRLRATK